MKKSLNYHSPLSHSFVNYVVIKFEKVLKSLGNNNF